jgi:hypothetical protein
MPIENGIQQKLKNTDWIYWIAINEMIGGIFGLAISIFVISMSVSLMMANLIQQPLSFSNIMNIAAPGIFAIILYGFSIAAGWFLLHGDPRGLPLSLFIQIMQLIRLAIPGILIYQFASGFALPIDIGFSSTGFKFNINLSFSSFSFSLFPASEENIFLIGTNLIAIFSFRQLQKKRNQLQIIDGNKEDNNS